jgi:hypothetical protein
MRSLESRLEAIEKAAEQLTAEETIIEVEPVEVATREELAALDRAGLVQDAPDHPPVRGKVRIELVGFTTAREVLALHGIILPQTETIETPIETETE